MVADLQKTEETITTIKRDQGALQQAQQAENDKETNEQLDKSTRERTEKITQAAKEQEDLKREVATAGLNDEQKVAEDRKKLAEDQQKQQSFVGPKDRLQTLQEQNTLLRDQLELTRAISEATRQNAEGEQRRKDLLQEQAEAQGDVHNAEMEARIYHGSVSSARRLGFGAAGPSDNKDQLQTLRKAEDHLAAIRRKLESQKQPDSI
ncbi:MAG: hypothetical protein WDO13_06225 [Verrucomicrobiota bacterium]